MFAPATMAVRLCGDCVDGCARPDLVSGRALSSYPRFPAPRSVRGSPFDQYKRVGPDGTEFWSARDLMESMGYYGRNAWANFSSAIDRARVSAEAQGVPVTSAFTDTSERVRAGSGTTLRADVLLTRYAAYLVAMNGDPLRGTHPN